MNQQEKTAHRQRLRSRLRTIAPADAALWSARIAAHLTAWLPPAMRQLAVFSALPGEPDLTPFLESHSRAVLHYPRVTGSALTFHAVSDRSSLRPGTYDILEPNHTHHPETPIEQIDAFLCPGLGFTEDGTRLGRGKGYYDRALAQARPDALRVGIAFALQICEHLPSERFDCAMTHLVDQTGWRKVRPHSPPQSD